MKKFKFIKVMQLNFSVLSCSVLSDSLQPHGLEPTRLLCPWDSPGKKTGVGCHALLQGIFPAQGLNPALLYCRQILYHLSHQESWHSLIGLLRLYTAKLWFCISCFFIWINCRVPYATQDILGKGQLKIQRTYEIPWGNNSALPGETSKPMKTECIVKK